MCGQASRTRSPSYERLVLRVAPGEVLRRSVGAIRNVDAHGEPARRSTARLESMFASVQREQSRPRVAESNAIAMLARASFADTVIDDAQLEPVATSRRADDHVP